MIDSANKRQELKKQDSIVNQKLKENNSCSKNNLNPPQKMVKRKINKKKNRYTTKLPVIQNSSSTEMASSSSANSRSSNPVVSRVGIKLDSSDVGHLRNIIESQRPLNDPDIQFSYCRSHRNKNGQFIISAEFGHRYERLRRYLRGLYPKRILYRDEQRQQQQQQQQEGGCDGLLLGSDSQQYSPTRISLSMESAQGLITLENEARTMAHDQQSQVRLLENEKELFENQILLLKEQNKLLKAQRDRAQQSTSDRSREEHDFNQKYSQILAEISALHSSVERIEGKTRLDLSDLGDAQLFRQAFEQFSTESFNLRTVNQHLNKQNDQNVYQTLANIEMAAQIIRQMPHSSNSKTPAQNND